MADSDDANEVPVPRDIDKLQDCCCCQVRQGMIVLDNVHVWFKTLFGLISCNCGMLFWFAVGKACVRARPLQLRV